MEMDVTRYFSVAIVALCVAACGGDAPQDDVAQADSAAVESGPQFAAALGIELADMTRTPSGVFYQDVRAGRGATAELGKNVTVEYRGWLPDGTLFEERPNAQGWGPTEFRLGVSPPVPGFDEGLAGMKVGGVRKLVIPPELGYGLVGRPAGVPEGSMLVFEVTLTNVTNP